MEPCIRIAHMHCSTRVCDVGCAKVAKETALCLFGNSEVVVACVRVAATFVCV